MTERAEWLGTILQNPDPVDRDHPKSNRYRAVRIYRSPTEFFDVGVGDFVHLRSGTDTPYVARVRALWQNSDGKQVRINWLYRPAELPIQAPMDCKVSELFFSSHEDTNPLMTVLASVRVRLVHPTNGKTVASPLYADRPSINYSKESSLYECSRYYNVTAGSLSKLTPEQFKMLSQYNRSPEHEDLERAGLPRASSSTSSPPNENASSKSPTTATKVTVQTPSPPSATGSVAQTVSESSLPLEHAARCQNPSCLNQGCAQMKQLTAHKKSCTVVACPECQPYDNLVLKHAKQCTEPLKECTIFACSENKPSTWFEHAVECTKRDCNVPNCKPAKKVIDHVRGCTDSSQCKICSKFEQNLGLHELGCGKRCIFPQCAHFSSTLRHSTENCTDVECRRCWLYKTLLKEHEGKCDRRVHDCNFPGCKGRIPGRRSPTPASIGSQTVRKRGKFDTMDGDKDRVSPVTTTNAKPVTTGSEAAGEPRRESRVGIRFQAQIPTFLGYRVSGDSPTASDEVVWTPARGLSETLIETTLGQAQHSIIQRGCIVAVPFHTISSSSVSAESAVSTNKRFLWVRVSEVPASNLETLSVAPIDVAWPKNLAASSFVLLSRSHSFAVNKNVLKFPDELQERALLSLYKRSFGNVATQNKIPVLGADETDILATWTEDEMDKYTCALLKEGAGSLSTIASNCRHPIRDIVELTVRLYKKGGVQVFPAGLVSCSVCTSHSVPVTLCQRFFHCQSAFCGKCMDATSGSKKRCEDVASMVCDVRITPDMVFFCPPCVASLWKKGTPGEESVKKAETTDGLDPAQAWLRWPYASNAKGALSGKNTPTSHVLPVVETPAPIIEDTEKQAAASPLVNETRTSELALGPPASRATQKPPETNASSTASRERPVLAPQVDDRQASKTSSMNGQRHSAAAHSAQEALALAEGAPYHPRTKKRYPDNESIFVDYDSNLLSPEEAVDLIRELLIAQSAKMIDLLSKGGAASSGSRA